jgi:hypothetical protein
LPFTLGTTHFTTGDGATRLNVAVTVPVRVRVQAPEPVQPPLQPAKFEPEPAAAERVTLVPASKSAVHVVPQAIPAGALVTVPAPVPASATSTVNFGVGTVTVSTTWAAAA